MQKAKGAITDDATVMTELWYIGNKILGNVLAAFPWNRCLLFKRSFQCFNQNNHKLIHSTVQARDPVMFQQCGYW